MRAYSKALIASLLTASALAGAARLSAQSVQRTDTARAQGKPLFTRDDGFLALGFAGLTVAMFPADKALAKRLREPSSSENKFIAKVTTGSETLAHPGALIVSSAAYVAGKVAHRPALADVGLHSTESLLLSTLITDLAKDLGGRSRPFVSNGTDPKDFKFGAGFSSDDRKSFPSGHTTAAFAAASALTSEVKHWYPNAVWVAGPVLYTGATVAVSPACITTSTGRATLHLERQSGHSVESRSCAIRTIIPTIRSTVDSLDLRSVRTERVVRLSEFQSRGKRVCVDRHVTNAFPRSRCHRLNAVTSSIAPLSTAVDTHRCQGPRRVAAVNSASLPHNGGG
jgi:membrane-associated phospholipid phosphatase